MAVSAGHGSFSHIRIYTHPLVLLPHSYRMNAAPFLGIGVPPCLFMDDLLLETFIVYFCLVKVKEG